MTTRRPSSASVDVDDLIALLETKRELKADDASILEFTDEVDVDADEVFAGHRPPQSNGAIVAQEKSRNDDTDYSARNDMDASIRDDQVKMKQDMERMERQMVKFMKASIRASLKQDGRLPESAMMMDDSSRRTSRVDDSSRRNHRGMDASRSDNDGELQPMVARISEEPDPTATDIENIAALHELGLLDDSANQQDISENTEETDDRRKRFRRMTSLFNMMAGQGSFTNRSSQDTSTFGKNFLKFFGGAVNDEEEEEDDFMDTLPEDSFSVMMVSKIASMAFWAAIMVAVVQVGTFFLLTFNLIENSDDPSNPLDIPANVTTAVRVTQVILLSIAVLSQDAIRTGIALIFKGYSEPLEAAFKHVNLCKFCIIVFLRIAEGSLGLIVTFMLIFDSETVIDLLLNFTAVEFISQLDEIFFGLASQGFLGARLKKQSLLVKETKFEASTCLKDPKNPSAGRERRGVRLHLILIGTWIALMAAWIFLLINQSNGVYLCQSIQVQFEDDYVSSLGAFSGIYDIDSSKSVPFKNDRVRYIDRSSGKAVFAYCSKLSAWSFAYAEDGHFPDPCIDWVAHSEQSETFDVLETAKQQWTVRNPQDQAITIEHFHLKCMDCDRAEDFAGECHEHGTCSNAICHCDEGWFGLRCEFRFPCDDLEMDIRFDGFVSERQWSRDFELFEVDGKQVFAYDRPVYVNEPRPGNFDIIAFTGRRWMATHSESLESAKLAGIEDPSQRRHKLGEYFLDHFHAYWSDFVASFISEPMDIGTESDAATPVEVEWFTAKPKNALHPHEVQEIDHSVAPLDSVLLCSVCNNDTNICLNDGTCMNGACECMIGSFGSLCQIPPTGNGRCDPQFDIPKYSYDGGDCCESTCISGDVYHCGKDETGFIDVGYFFCIHEFDEWHLNRANFDGLSAETRYAMALSDDGHILTLGEPNAGHVTLFDADGSVWVKRGRVLEGPLGSNFGAHVAMSKGLTSTVKNFLTVDPVRVAASGWLRNKGFVRIYECLSEGCAQSGQDLVIENLSPHSRTIHDVSKDGTIVAFGAYNETRNLTVVDFYHYEEAPDIWTHEGTPTLEFEGAAYALKLSGDFETVAIRSVAIWEGIGKDEYHRRFEATDAKAVFHLNSQTNKWDQYGHTIYHHIDGHSASAVPDDFHILGTRHRLSEFLQGSNPLDLSDDGLVMAVGFPFSKEDPGVHVYEFDQDVGEWVDRGHTISNNHTFGFKGWSVALSGNGEVVVVGTGGEDTATNTYLWDGEDWQRYSHEIPGGEQSSIALSIDGSVLAVGRESVDVYHRNIKTKCPDDMEWFHLSLTLDTHPEDTRWDLVSNVTGKMLLSGGPYIGNPDGFPYYDAYARSTIVVEACVPRNECKVFSIYDRLDPMTDEFTTPDGMLSPAVYDLQVDGVEVAKRQLDQACDHYYFGEGCESCPEGTHSLKVLIRACVPYYWTLREATAGLVLVGDDSAEYEAYGNFTYLRDGTCQHLGFEVHTYWEEACVDVADLEHDCFDFDLGAHPNWDIAENMPGDVEIDHAHRNTEVVLIFDDKQITVDLALVGSKDAGPPSEIHYQFGGACKGRNTTTDNAGDGH